MREQRLRGGEGKAEIYLLAVGRVSDPHPFLADPDKGF